MPSRDYNWKTFLDETATNLATIKQAERRDLFVQLSDLVLESEDAEVCEEILSFCSASVIEMIKSAEDSLERLLKSFKRLKKYSKFHVLVDAVTSTYVALENTQIDENVLLESVISGLTAIESQTISLSGSSLIKLLKKDPHGISMRLAEHSDFVAVLTADMCAMFSRLDEESNAEMAPFIRIVRFCELILDLSGDANLEQKILKTMESEFINKIYRTELKEMKGDRSEALKWCNALLKSCHRGNQLVRPLVHEVFTGIDVGMNGDNADLREILANERIRPIKGVAALLFTERNMNEMCRPVLNIPEPVQAQIIDDSIYRCALKRMLNSIDLFPVSLDISKCELTSFAASLLQENREILINWLPYCLQVCELVFNDAEMAMYIDISRRINDYNKQL